jgi:hypothetical protein
MVDQRASGTPSAGKGGFGNADGRSFLYRLLPGAKRRQYILGNGDGDVVHVNFFTVGDTNTLGDG